MLSAFLNRKIPPYIYRSYNLTLLVVCTAIFAIVFINIYEPFQSSDWYGLSRFEYLLYSSLLTLIGILVVAISRTVMFYYTKKNTITYYNYAIWILAEIMAMSFLYTLISYTLNETRDFWEVLNSSARNTSLILLIPYFVLHMFFVLQEKNRLLNEAKEKVNAITISGAPATQESSNAAARKDMREGIITFSDDKGEMKLSIKKESLLYIESADNYVEIWYIGKMGVSNYLLRNTLKSMEEKFRDTNVIRTHRSFIVNCDQVKIARRTKAGLVLDLGIEKVPDIPVSKNYGDQVMEWLMSVAKK